MSNANLNQDLEMAVRMADAAWCEGLFPAFRSHMEAAADLSKAGAELMDEESALTYSYLKTQIR